MIRECRSEDFEQLMKISSLEVMDNDLTNTIKDAKNFIKRELGDKMNDSINYSVSFFNSYCYDSDIVFRLNVDRCKFVYY